MTVIYICYNTYAVCCNKTWYIVQLWMMRWSRKWRGLRWLPVRCQIPVTHIAWDCSMSYTTLPSSRNPSKTQPSTRVVPGFHRHSTLLILMYQTIRCYPTQTHSQIWCSKTILRGSRVWTSAKGIQLWSQRAARSLPAKAAAPSNLAYPDRVLSFIRFLCS